MKRTVFRVACRRASYCLNRLIAAGISCELAEGSKNEVVFSVSGKDAAKAEEVLRRETLSYSIEGYRGMKPLLLRFAKRPFLLLSILLSLAGVILFENFVYGYTIKGNSFVNRASVVAVLRENNAEGFRLKSQVDLGAIKRDLLSLEGVSFAGVKFVGTRLQVEIKESLPLENPTEPQFAPLCASHSAVVTKVIAESGTPRVKSGQVVKAGDPLIEPIYAFTEGEGAAPAAGEVWGVVTHRKEVALPAFCVESVLTGEVIRLRSVKLFGKTLGKESAPPFATYDYEERVIWRGIGVEVTEKVYKRREERVFCHDLDAEADATVKSTLIELLLDLPVSARERGTVRVVQKKVDNILLIVLYYTVEQRIDSLPFAP